MKFIPLIMLLAVAAAGCNDATRSSTTGAAATNEGAATVVDGDNTAVNERDRVGETKTPIDQNENQKDINVTANIRKKVVSTEMSVNAHNVKIITQEGKVTLRGPVKTAAEKQQIEDIALSFAGAGNVDNQLDVEQQP